ncbi:hypothetical protein B0O99DRAFT_674359 [Bisporella sp. PMI_857]|nr:hypothetical protein B0O99DRAFT_674359 [Bisporella sp. PMI_857]
MSSLDNKISGMRAIPASKALAPEDSTINIQHACEPQKSKPSSEPRKHGFAGCIEDLGNPGSKRFKASPDSPRLRVRSPRNKQHSSSVVTYDNTGKFATGQIHPGKLGHHSLRDYQLLLMLLEQHGEASWIMARQCHDKHSSIGSYMPGDVPNHFPSDRVNRTFLADSINKGIGSPNNNFAIAAQPSVAQASTVNPDNHQLVPTRPPNYKRSTQQKMRPSGQGMERQAVLLSGDPRSAIPSTHRVKKALQAHQELLEKKQAEVDSLAKYGGVEMTPEPQQGNIQHGRDKAMSTMQREVKELDMWLEECL